MAVSPSTGEGVNLSEIPLTNALTAHEIECPI